MEDLKGCPFCGGEAALQAQQGNNPAPFAWHVIHHCEGGFMRFGENCGFTKDEAIAAWNRRAAPPREAVGVGIEGASRTESTDARCDATAEDTHNHSEGED